MSFLQDWYCTKGPLINVSLFKLHIDSLNIHFVVFKNLMGLLQTLLQFHRWLEHSYTEGVTSPKDGVSRQTRILSYKNEYFKATNGWETSFTEVLSFAPPIKSSSGMRKWAALAKVLWTRLIQPPSPPHLPRTGRYFRSTKAIPPVIYTWFPLETFAAPSKDHTILWSNNLRTRSFFVSLASYTLAPTTEW